MKGPRSGHRGQHASGSGQNSEDLPGSGRLLCRFNRFNLLDYKEHLDYRLSRNLRLVSRLRVAEDHKGK